MEKQEDKNSDQILEKQAEIIKKEMKKGFSLLAIQVVKAAEEIKRLKEDMEKMKECFKEVNRKLGGKGMGEISGSDQGHLAKEDVSILKTDIMDVKMELRDVDMELKSRRGGQDVVHAHGKRLDKIEKKILTM